MKLFFQLLEKSVIIRGALVIIVTMVWAALILEGRSTPPELWLLIGMSWTWFFATGAIKDAHEVLLSKEGNRRITDKR